MGAQGPIYSTNGMVVSGHPLAAEAGLLMLERGGSATDALIASAAVLCVALPQAVTIGGDAFGLFYEASNKSVHGLNATGRAPGTASPDRLTREDLETGARSPTVPALVRGWENAHRRFGRLPWAALLAPAIDAAQRGVPVSRILAQALTQHHGLVSADPGLAALLIPGQKPLTEGDTLRQPALAQTLRAIASEGSKTFYDGRIAGSLIERLARGGGLLRADDFAACSTQWVTPLKTAYRGHTIATVPPNSFGLIGLLQLKYLEEQDVDLASRTPDERLATLITAAERAFATGSRYLADPETTQENPGDALTLAPGQSGPEPPSTIGLHSAGTAVAMAVDREGNAALIVQSVFTLFGSGVYDAATGILLNNRMRGFSLEPGHPNVVAVGKRPAHTLTPMMVLRDGALRLVLGTPGGPGQTPTLVQVITNRIDNGLDLASAISSPRWSYDLERRAIVEAEISDATVDDLASRGIPVHRPTAATPFFGSVKAIEIGADGKLCGVADSRRDGAVAGT